MQLNPKKIVGNLGRRFGGKPFQIARKFCYDSVAFGRQLYELVYLARKTYAPLHSDRAFVDKYYSGHFEGDPSEIKKGYICMCDGRMFHGGPTDRLRGILTTYEEAKKQNVPFYIHWTNPFPLEDYLVPASFDWRIDSSQLVYDKRHSFPFIIEDEPDFQSWLRMKVGMKHHKAQIHVYSNADNSRGNYRKLFFELFKPSPELQKETEKHLQVIGENYEGFTLRFRNLLGDFKEWWEEKIDEKDVYEFIERVFQEFEKLTTGIPKDRRILVTSDSRRFLDYIESKDPRVYVVPGDVKNIDLQKGEFKRAWLKTFTDQQLLMQASKVTLLRTGNMFKSGFPRFAAEVGGAEYVDHLF